MKRTPTNVTTAFIALLDIVLKFGEGSQGVYTDASGILFIVLVLIFIADFLSDGKLNGVIAGFCHK